jgi:tetratricopeptide (TPR) repeat protein
LKGARENYEKALAADVKYFPAIEGLAAVDVLEKNRGGAQANGSRAEGQAEEVRAITALANLDESEGRPKQLIVDRLSKAISFKPNDPLLRARLIQLYVKEHDHKLALSAAQEAVAALPNDLDMLALLAATQVTAGATSQAISSYSKLVMLRPRSPLRCLGWPAHKLRPSLTVNALRR